MKFKQRDQNKKNTKPNQIYKTEHIFWNKFHVLTFNDYISLSLFRIVCMKKRSNVHGSEFFSFWFGLVWFGTEIW